MFKLQCKLKQQTPMLHFQPDETGACLRGTEVKPKLDKFIRKCFQIQDNIIPDQWYLETKKESREGKSVFALNYQIRFETSGTPEINDGSKERPINKSFFGNQGVKDPSMWKKTVLYHESINMTILCFIPDLLEYIKNHIEDFFVIYNFGTRQTKGFGAFVVSEINGEQIDYKKKDYLSIAKKYFSYGLYHEYKNIDEAKKYALEDIRIIYGLMKSGFNLSDQKKEDYFKGYIFRYFYQKYPDYMNDKKFIKTHLKFKNCNTEKIEKIEKEKDNREGIYCRAVLGLAQKYEYKNLYEGTVEVIGESQKTENGNMVVERFPSPILWTLAGKYLLALPAEEALSLILNQKFCFQISENNKATIKTPEEFNFKDFLYEFQKDFNDKELHKGGEKGLKDAENVMLMRAGSLELKNF